MMWKCAIVAGLLALGCGVSEAATYKCKDASGKLSFQQRPCPAEASSETVNTQEGSWVWLGSREGSSGARIDTFYDAASIKDLVDAGTGERYQRVSFKQVEDVSWGTRIERHYRYVDCQKGLVTSPDSRDWDGVTANMPVGNFFWFQGDQFARDFKSGRQFLEATCANGVPRRQAW